MLQKSGRPVTATGKTNVSKVREIIKSDGGNTIRGVFKVVGISLLRVHFMLKRILKVRKISARWIRHVLTDEIKFHKNMATRILNNQRQFIIRHQLYRLIYLEWDILYLCIIRLIELTVTWQKYKHLSCKMHAFLQKCN